MFVWANNCLDSHPNKWYRLATRRFVQSPNLNDELACTEHRLLAKNTLEKELFETLNNKMTFTWVTTACVRFLCETRLTECAPTLVDYSMHRLLSGQKLQVTILRLIDGDTMIVDVCLPLAHCQHAQSTTPIGIDAHLRLHVTVRLFGVDADEMNTALGKQLREQMSNIVDKTYQCHFLEVDLYGRYLVILKDPTTQELLNERPSKQGAGRVYDGTTRKECCCSCCLSPGLNKYPF